jgi:hypothetical protein
MKTQRLRYIKGIPLKLGVAAEDFRVGQQVRLIELGIARTTRAAARTGTVAGLPAASTIDVLFHGNKRPTKLHRSYLELDHDEMISPAGRTGLKAKTKG